MAGLLVRFLALCCPASGATGTGWAPTETRAFPVTYFAGWEGRASSSTRKRGSESEALNSGTDDQQKTGWGSRIQLLG